MQNIKNASIVYSEIVFSKNLHHVKTNQNKSINYWKGYF